MILQNLRLLFKSHSRSYIYLKNMLLPKYYHQLVLGKILAGQLKKIDSKVRRFVRDLLHLTPDVPSSAFHAREKYCGKDIPCLKWNV